MKLSIKHFVCRCDEIRTKLRSERLSSHILLPWNDDVKLWFHVKTNDIISLIIMNMEMILKWKCTAQKMRFSIKDFLRKCEFLISCFGLMTKIKKGSGTRFQCIFSTYFFYKNVAYLMLYHFTKFQYQTYFSSQDIKQNVFLNFC